MACINKQNHAEVTKMLLAAGADRDSADARGHTPLHLAFAGGHLELVELLLEAGADNTIRDSEDNTPEVGAPLSGFLRTPFGG